MKSAVGALVLSTFIVGSAAAESIYPVKFENLSFAADLKVKFVDLSFAADEKWYVAGKCEDASSVTKIKVVTLSFGADIKIKLVSTSIGADRKICIVNAAEAPDEFWAAYKP